MKKPWIELSERGLRDAPSVCSHPVLANIGARDNLFFIRVIHEQLDCDGLPWHKLNNDLTLGEQTGLDLFAETGKSLQLGELGFNVIELEPNNPGVCFTDDWRAEMRAGRARRCGKVIICATPEMRHLAATALIESGYEGRVTQAGSEYRPLPQEAASTEPELGPPPMAA
ncbi:hypothetical protein N9A51_00940 [Pseudomonadales bacterium]|nr:hypothetical protein [Pseudomonadales bacterium]